MKEETFSLVIIRWDAKLPFNYVGAYVPGFHRTAGTVIGFTDDPDLDELVDSRGNITYSLFSADQHGRKHFAIVRRNAACSICNKPITREMDEVREIRCDKCYTDKGGWLCSDECLETHIKQFHKGVVR